MVRYGVGGGGYPTEQNFWKNLLSFGLFYKFSSLDAEKSNISSYADSSLLPEKKWAYILNIVYIVAFLFYIEIFKICPKNFTF